jgi:APA family basic amino acid/polyamine antiporter
MNKADMPIHSCLLGMVISLVWMVIHYICQSTGILGNSDVSEIAIMSSYLLYLPLYYVVFRLWKNKEIKSVFMGLLVPIMAVLGSAIAILGGLQNPLFIWYLLICAAMLLIAFVYYGKHKDDIHSV